VIYDLGESHDARVVPALIAFFQNPANKTEYRGSAATSLGKLGDLRAVEPLIASLKEDNFTITQNASAALAQLKDKRAIDPLKQAYIRWSSGKQQYADTVKGSIQMALVQLGAEPVRSATGSPN
jgi:HEAT repeats